MRTLVVDAYQSRCNHKKKWKEKKNRCRVFFSCVFTDSRRDTPPRDGEGLIDFYHNWTKFILHWKITYALPEIVSPFPEIVSPSPSLGGYILYVSFV